MVKYGDCNFDEQFEFKIPIHSLQIMHVGNAKDTF